MKEEKKIEYWNHFLTLENYWSRGVTRKRLERVKSHIWNNNHFWSDVLQRHRGAECSPQEMKAVDEFNYNHCFANMSAMICDALIDNNIIKP